MVEFLLTLPAVVKIIASLVLIVAVNRFLKQLLYSVLIGALFLGLWYGHSLFSLPFIAWQRFSSIDNLMLMVVIIEVISLSTLMSRSGVMADLVEAVQSRISRRAALAVLPAIIGLLPMPGGAYFSAPMVDSCDTEKNIQSLLKTQINYWFRHIWEGWWPLYPGFLVAVDIMNVEIWQFMLVQIPVSLLTVFSGYWFLLRRVPVAARIKDEKSTGADRKNGQPLLVLITPILVTIAVYTLITIFLPFIGQINKYLPMIVGLLMAVITLQVQRPQPAKEWRQIIFTKRTLFLVLLIGAVRIYGAVIDTPLPSGLLLVEQMRLELVQWGIPFLAVMALIPLFSGMAMGVTVGYVGASFPIVLSLLGPDPSLMSILSACMLAYGIGFVGQMLTPMHVCLVVTNDYFKTRLFPSIISLLKPAAGVSIGIFAFYFLLQFFV